MNPFTFHVPAGHKPGACAASESTRYLPASALAFRSADQCYLASCDGKMLAVLPVQSADGPETPTLVPAKAINANGKPLECTADKELRTSDGKQTKIHPMPEQAGRWPAIGAAFPDPVKVIEGYSVLTVDADQIKALASALSNQSRLVLFIPPPRAEEDLQVKDAIAIVGLSDDGSTGSGIGALMPFTYHAKGQKTVIQEARGFYAKHVENIPKAGISVER